MTANGYPDVDVVLTTGRAGPHVLGGAGLILWGLPEEECDEPFGHFYWSWCHLWSHRRRNGSCSPTVYELVTGTELENLDFEDVRGMDGIKSATVELPLKEAAAAAGTQGLIRGQWRLRWLLPTPWSMPRPLG